MRPRVGDVLVILEGQSVRMFTGHPTKATWHDAVLVTGRCVITVVDDYGDWYGVLLANGNVMWVGSYDLRYLQHVAW